MIRVVCVKVAHALLAEVALHLTAITAPVRRMDAALATLLAMRRRRSFPFQYGPGDLWRNTFVGKVVNVVNVGLMPRLSIEPDQKE